MTLGIDRPETIAMVIVALFGLDVIRVAVKSGRSP
jgi:hypothetical protein